MATNDSTPFPRPSRDTPHRPPPALGIIPHGRGAGVSAEGDTGHSAAVIDFPAPDREKPRRPAFLPPPFSQHDLLAWAWHKAAVAERDLPMLLALVSRARRGPFVTWTCAASVECAGGAVRVSELAAQCRITPRRALNALWRLRDYDFVRCETGPWGVLFEIGPPLAEIAAVMGRRES